MKKISLMISLVAFLALAACNKDQEAVNQLDGTWEEVSINEEPVPDSSKGEYRFESCKLKSEEFCKAFYTSADGDVLEYNFQVKEKGTKLSFNVDDPTFGEITLTSNIVELTESKLVLSLSILGQSTVTEYKKK